METSTANNSENGQAPNQNPQAQAANSDGQAPNETPNNSISIEDLQRQLKELRAENASHRRKNKEQEEAAEQARQAQLKEQGKYKELAEKHEARVNELEPLQGRYEQLASQVSEQIKADTKSWPAEVMAFYPGDDAPVEQKNDWYHRSKPLIEKLKLQEQSSRPGNAPNPRPSQQPAEGPRLTYEQRLRASGKYGA